MAVIIDGNVPLHSANQYFLNLLNSNNPRYTGWPVWVILQNTSDTTKHPYVAENGTWEALINATDIINFWRLNPTGKFFIKSALEDDFGNSSRGLQPFTTLDFGLAIYRTGEAIAVALSFAKAMGCVPEKTKLFFCFKWTRLKKRELCSWAFPGRIISPGGKAYQNELLASVAVPLDTPHSALGPFVHQLTKPLFEVFNGFKLSLDVIEDLIRRLIEKRL